MPWYDYTNSVWRQVGQEIGAEFEFRELWERNLSAGYTATLIKSSIIELSYRAHFTELQGSDTTRIGTTTEMHAVARTDPSLYFKIGRHLLWHGRPTKIRGKQYQVRCSDQRTLKGLLEDDRVQQLIPEALPDLGWSHLGRSHLVLERGVLRFIEDSSEDESGHKGILAHLSENWRVPISDPNRLKALFQLFEVLLARLPRTPPPVVRTAGRAADPIATEALRRWTLRSSYYSNGRVIDLDPEGERLVVQKLDPITRREWSAAEPRNRLCFVPDSRFWRNRSGEPKSHVDEPEDFADTLNFGGFSLRSVRVKGFPMFWNVESVRWPYYVNDETDPVYIEPDIVDRFSERLADVLSKSSQLEESIKEANIDLRIACPGIWVVVAPFTATLTRPLRDCFKIIAEILLGMPIPTEEQDAPA